MNRYTTGVQGYRIVRALELLEQIHSEATAPFPVTKPLPLEATAAVAEALIALTRAYAAVAALEAPRG
jgi:hypothetical protein